MNSSLMIHDVERIEVEKIEVKEYLETVKQWEKEPTYVYRTLIIYTKDGSRLAIALFGRQEKNLRIVSNVEQLCSSDGSVIEEKEVSY